MPAALPRARPKSSAGHGAPWARRVLFSHFCLASLTVARHWAAFALSGHGPPHGRGRGRAAAAHSEGRTGPAHAATRPPPGAARRGLPGPGPAARASGDEAATAPASSLHSRLRVTAMSEEGGSFLLEMGGQRLLVNPRLDGPGAMLPEKVHEEVDYVVITSSKSEFMHGPSIGRMNLAKTNFVTCGAAGEALSRLMPRNLAVLAPGPGGRVMLEGDGDAAPIAAIVTPGAQALPWETPEVGFVFVNLETGVALGYEAKGQFLGQGASSDRDGIPEEAYQVDYLVTSDLSETAGVVKGLATRGTALRGVVALPSLKNPVVDEAESNPALGLLLAQDRFVGSLLGEVKTPDEFRAMLSQQESPLSQTRLYEASASGEPTELE